MPTWKLKSVPPHDFFLCLDIDDYFDHEHDPSVMFEEGFTRPVPVSERDVLVTIFFNGDPEEPEFTIECSDSLSDSERDEANKALTRILGLDLDLKPLYEKASDDTVLGGKLTEFYGLKRIARANFFEDAVNRVIRTQISHKPTARKMVYGVREAYGEHLSKGKKTIAAWPRPIHLVSSDPVMLKQYGLSLRKGEYMADIANEFIAGDLTLDELETMPSREFYDRILKIRGIGPTTAQDLMMMRNRPDCVFPSNMTKGQERGLRRWIIWSYGGDPDTVTEEEFQQMTTNWQGYESMALEFMYVNWVVSEKRKKHAEGK